MEKDFRLHLSKVPYFLYLLPIFFVLHAFVYHYPLISSSDAFEVLITYIVAVTILALFFYFVFRNIIKTGIFVFSLFCFHLFFGTLLEGIKRSFLPNLFSKYSFLLPFLLVVLTAWFIYLFKAKQKFVTATVYLNLVLTASVFIETVQLFLKPKQGATTQTIIQHGENDNRPDIYFVIADEYAGKKQLADVFKFDNSPFENELRKRGFYVIADSKSNYNYTPMSVASILNMNYLSGISRDCRDVKNSIASFNNINTGSVQKFLSGKGYSFVNNSIFEFAEQPAKVDNVFFSTRKKLITSQTFTERLMKDIGFNFVTRFKIFGFVKYWAYFTLNNNETLFSNTIEESKKNSEQPRFIYLHQTMPHYPYYFNESGKPNAVAELEEGKQVNQKNYIGYLQFANKKYLELLDNILTNSKTQPVIVFMSDHGFRHFTDDFDSSLQFSSINAVNLPNKKYAQFYPGMSGVNQFRILFNTMFQENFPVLKDSTIFLWGF